jgi:arylsulfotransferase ASST
VLQVGVRQKLLLAIVAASGLATAPEALAHARANSRLRPTISPAPGTPDASPDTQISILGVVPKRIRSIRVSGSSSGLHEGAFHAYSGRRGASFVLRRPLVQGERVTVTAKIDGRRPLTWTFTVARLAPVPPVLSATALQPSKLDHFVTEPQLLPPRISVNHGSLAGDILLTPLPSPEVHPGSNNALTINPVGPGGPMIIDGRGQLLWFHQLAPPTVAADLRLERFNGHNVLTWWQGKVTIAAYGLGEGVIANRSYHTIAVVHAGNGYQADIHEFRLTPSGDALITINSLVLRHLPGDPPGAMSRVLDSIVQEVDVRTGLVLWEWHALGHIPLVDSYATQATSPYLDAYHLNSIQPLADGRFLVSARDTAAIYEIDRATGRVVWTLGGKASSFRLAHGARFWFQHDAQLLPGDRVSLFDDGGGPPFYEASSRGLILCLDVRRHVARVCSQYRRPGDHTPADSEGSLQTLAGGNMFAGFGSEPFFSEFSSRGRLLFDGSLPADDGSYRAFAAAWDGVPATRPAVAARRASPGHVTVYASWNGATAVARWQVMARTESGALRSMATVRRRGFETRVTVASGAQSFVVRARDARGRILRSSHAVHVS